MLPSQPKAQSLRSPDPWLAVNYAVIFPGLGQLYSGHWWKGGSWVAIALFLLSYGLWSIFGAYGNTVQGFWALGLLMVVYSFSILDAYRGTQADYATRISVPKGRRDVWYAVFLSQLLPGLGHLYAQQAAVGGLLLVAGLLAAWWANRQPLLAPLPPAIWAFSCYHVYLGFPQRSRRQSTAIALLILGIFLTRFVVSNAPHWIVRRFCSALCRANRWCRRCRWAIACLCGAIGAMSRKRATLSCLSPPQRYRQPCRLETWKMCSLSSG